MNTALTEAIDSASMMIVNLPWGENVFSYHGEGDRIIRSIGALLSPQCQCAFISRDHLAADMLRDTGFHVTDVIEVGKPSKKEFIDENIASLDVTDSDSLSQRLHREGRCVITFAVKL